MNLTNDVLPVFSTNFESMDLPFASTYNCMAGDTVRIQGRNFGDTSLVRINGQPCEGQPLISQAILADDTDVEEVISCVLPPGPPGLVTQPIAGILLSLQLNSDGYSARGGDGFAFVVQNVGQEAIGEGGFHLGYGGIPNSLSVEFDTTYNPEMLDLYENHISVHTRGYDVANSGDHSYSLGATSQ
ncbi:unnamed protein product [Aphanomyces euteiches]